MHTASTGEAGVVLQRGLQLAVDAGEILEEGLILEALAETRRRAGDHPDPAITERMNQIFGGLGILGTPAEETSIT